MRLPDLSGSDEHLAVLAVVDGDGVGVVEEVDAAVLAVAHDHLFSCERRKRFRSFIHLFVLLCPLSRLEGRKAPKLQPPTKQVCFRSRQFSPAGLLSVDSRVRYKPRNVPSSWLFTSFFHFHFSILAEQQ